MYLIVNPSSVFIIFVFFWQLSELRTPKIITKVFISTKTLNHLSNAKAHNAMTNFTLNKTYGEITLRTTRLMVLFQLTFKTFK